MTDNIIEVTNLSKAYKLYDKKSDRLKEAFSFTKKKYHRQFFALNDLNLSIRRGENFGIIGTNGSGKSTLLKILSGVVTQTSGTVKVDGKVSALLELGAGFNPEYTGLENIALHGTMMGYSSAEMAIKREEIISFADIGDFINQPVKTYSSGMFARLAFATAVNVDPDILIVDETLSVGDMRFQIKCLHRMKDMMEHGTTILFVSHDISTIRRFCTRCAWINNGVLQAVGETNEVADLYTDFLKCGDLEKLSQKPVEPPTESSEEDIAPFKPKENKESIAEIIKFRVLDQAGKDVTAVNFDQPLTVKVTYDVYDTNVEEPVLGVALFSIDDDYVCGLNTLLDGVRIPWNYGRNTFTLTYPQGLRALGGKYYFDTALRDKTATVNIDYKKVIYEIQVSDGYLAEGRYVIPHKWETKDD